MALVRPVPSRTGVTSSLVAPEVPQLAWALSASEQEYPHLLSEDRTYRPPLALPCATQTREKKNVLYMWAGSPGIRSRQNKRQKKRAI